MLHQAEKERKIVLVDPLLVERQQERAALGMQQEVGVLHALGDALQRQRRAEIVAVEETRQRVVADFRIDGHQAAAGSRRLRGSGKNMFSSRVVSVSTSSA